MIGFIIFAHIANFEGRLFWLSLTQVTILTLFHHFAAATHFLLFKGTLIDTLVQKYFLPIEIPAGFRARASTN